MQQAAIEKSFDNLTIVMVAFKNIEDYFSSKNSSQKNIKILEEE